jgi:hypothetical protein
MRAGSNDKKLLVLISEDELDELKNISWAMSECFGLDRRIENYRGKRSIGLYSWDLECIFGAIEHVLNRRPQSSDLTASGRAVLTQLLCRLQKEYHSAFDG